MIEQESAMQEAFRKILHIAQSIQISLSEIVQDNDLGEHTQSAGNIAHQVRLLLELLSDAKDYHKADLINEQFLIPLFRDVQPAVLESVLGQLDKRTSGKIMRVVIKRLWMENDEKEASNG